MMSADRRYPRGVHDVLKAVLMLADAGRRGALATVVSTRGSTPQAVGARLLLREDGTCVGTVGGGAVEFHVLGVLREVLAEGKARVLRIDLGRDLGMSCGGGMEVFVEPITPAPRLVLCGAGHVAQATASLARKAGFHVVVADARQDLNSEQRFESCERLLCPPAEAANRLAEHPDEWVLFLAHSHEVDLEALIAFAQRPHRYLGLMGSRRKVIRMLERLRERAIEIPTDRLYAPVGIDLGAITPEEIAVSIVAELIALRRGAVPRHLRALDSRGKGGC